jgi:hypothetical protein
MQKINKIGKIKDFIIRIIVKLSTILIQYYRPYLYCKEMSNFKIETKWKRCKLKNKTLA